MTDKNSQPKASPPPKPSKNEDQGFGILEWFKRNAAVISLAITIVVTVVSATWWINSQIYNVRIETTKELQFQSSAIIEKVNDNKSELGILTERVSHIQDDVQDIRDKLENIQNNTHNNVSFKY